MVRRGRRESGALLLEALLSLALGLVVLGVALPLLSWSRALAGDLSRRAAATDGARLAGLRIASDLRRAGFGLASHPPAVTAAGGTLTVRYADGGFDGGTPVVEAAPAGQDHLTLAAVGDLAPGDEVLLRDRLARELLSRVTFRDAVLTRVGLADPLPFPIRPEEGPRLYRIVHREWRLAPDGLRRDGQPALDAPAELRTAPGAAAAMETLLTWLEAPLTGPAPPAPAPDLIAAQVRAGVPRAVRGLAPGRARPARPVTLLLLVGGRQPPVPAASPLP